RRHARHLQHLGQEARSGGEAALVEPQLDLVFHDFLLDAPLVSCACSIAISSVPGVHTQPAATFSEGEPSQLTCSRYACDGLVRGSSDLSTSCVPCARRSTSAESTLRMKPRCDSNAIGSGSRWGSTSAM